MALNQAGSWRAKARSPGMERHSSHCADRKGLCMFGGYILCSYCVAVLLNFEERMHPRAHTAHVLVFGVFLFSPLVDYPETPLFFLSSLVAGIAIDAGPPEPDPPGAPPPGGWFIPFVPVETHSAQTCTLQSVDCILTLYVTVTRSAQTRLSPFLYRDG